MASNSISIFSRAAGAIARRFQGWGANLGLPQDDSTLPTNGNGRREMGAVAIRTEAPSQYTSTGRTVRIRGFERHPVVQACVRAVVDIGSSIPLQAYTKRPAPDGRVDVDLTGEDHPLQQLVDFPSPFFSRRRFIATSFVHYLVYGNSAWYFERTRGEKSPPTELRIVHPEDVTAAWVDDRGYPMYVQWADASGRQRTSPITDVLLFRDLSAKGFVFGYPRAASALGDIIGDDEASQHVRQVVTNYGAPMAYALLHDEATQKEATEAEERLYEANVRRGERGRFRFLGVKDVKVVGFSLADLEFPDLRKIAREDICAAFGVDPRMIGIASASSDAGLSGIQYREARARLVQHTVEPMLLALESELNHWLSPEFGEVYLRFDPDALKALVEDDTATSTRVQAEVRANLRTIEEGRVAVGLPAEFEPDDTLLVGPGGALVPTTVALDQGEASATASITGSEAVTANGGQPPAAQLPAGEPASSSSADDEEDDEEDEARSRAPRQLPARIPAAVPVVTVRPQPRSLVLARASRSVVLTQELRAVLWRQFDERATREEAAYRRQALMLFGEERAAVARIFERAGGDRSSVRAEESSEADVAAAKTAARTLRVLYKPDGEVEQRWTERFHPLVGQTFSKGASQIAESVRSLVASSRAKPPKKKAENAPPPATVDPLAYDFFLEAPDVQAAIAARAKRLASHVGRTTAEAINSAIAVGIREKMGVRQIAELVDKVAFGASAGYRATMIARTETVGALNHGQFHAAEESEAVEGKEWLTQADDRVRDTHSECEAMGVIDLASPFTNGLQYPGDPAGDAADVINCRCTLLYYDSVDA